MRSSHSVNASHHEHGDGSCGHHGHAEPSEEAEQAGIDMLSHHAGVAGEEHDENDQWRRKHTIDYGRPEQSRHCIEAELIHDHAQCHGNSEHGIESPGAVRPVFQRTVVVGGLNDRVCTRARKHGNA